MSLIVCWLCSQYWLCNVLIIETGPEHHDSSCSNKLHIWLDHATTKRRKWLILVRRRNIEAFSGKQYSSVWMWNRIFNMEKCFPDSLQPAVVGNQNHQNVRKFPIIGPVFVTPPPASQRATLDRDSHPADGLGSGSNRYWGEWKQQKEIKTQSTVSSVGHLASKGVLLFE